MPLLKIGLRLGGYILSVEIKLKEVKMNNEVKELRELLILNQKEMAELLGVEMGTISRWERGLRRPRAVHRRKMARLLKKEENGRHRTL